jgi:hypothetical protein
MTNEELMAIVEDARAAREQGRAARTGDDD